MSHMYSRFTSTLRVLTFGLSAIALSASAQVPAASAAPAPLVPGTTVGISPIIATNPGDFNFTQYTKTVVQELTAREEFARDAKDLETFKNYVEQLNKGIEEFQAKLQDPETGLIAMSVKATQSIATPGEVFLTAINQYDIDQRNLRIKFANLASIASAFPSRTKLGFDQSGVDSVSKFGEIDFSVMSANLTKALDELTNKLKNLRQYVISGSGTPIVIAENTGKSMAPDFPMALSFSNETVKDWQAKIKKLRLLDGTEKDVLNAYTMDAQEKVQRFIKTWGTGERGRILNANDIKARATEAELILKQLWSRHYLRAVYGMSLGTFYMAEFKKRIGNIEIWLASTEDLCVFLDQPLWNDNLHIELEQGLRNALEIAQSRSVSVLEGGDPMSINGNIENTMPGSLPIGHDAVKAPLLQRANSLLTFLGGKRPGAMAASAMLQLVLADVIAERMLIQPGGIQAVGDFYQARFMTNPEDIEKFGKYAEEWDEENLVANSGAASANSFATMYYDALLVGKRMAPKQIQIEQYLKNIAMLTLNSKFDAAVNDRKNRFKAPKKDGPK